MLISQEICLILFFKMKVLKIFAVFANLNSNSFALLKNKQTNHKLLYRSILKRFQTLFCPKMRPCVIWSRQQFLLN